MKTELKEAREKIDAKRKTLAEIFEQSGTGADLDLSKADALKGIGDSAARVEFIRSLNTEIEDLVEKAKPLEDEYSVIEKARREAEAAGQLKQHPGHVTPGSGSGAQAEATTKSLGDLFIESGAGAEFKGDERTLEMPEADVMKTLFETSAGWAPEAIRTGKLVDYATRPIQVTDLFPSVPTSQSSVVYMEETTFTNNAAEVAEGGSYGEAALALTEQTSPVRKIAVFLPVTDEQLEDVAYARGYINNRLPFMLRQRLDGQVLVGDGTAPNLSGILDRAGINTQALGGDTRPDCAYKALKAARVTGRANPNAFVFHPNDWEPIRLLKTADGIYIWGSPSEAGPEKLWGLPVVQSDAITENTALVGDFATHAELAIRRNIEVKVSDSHSDYFVKGKQAVRADMRVALQVFRPAAFTQMTGL